MAKLFFRRPPEKAWAEVQPAEKPELSTAELSTIKLLRDIADAIENNRIALINIETADEINYGEAVLNVEMKVVCPAPFMDWRTK